MRVIAGMAKGRRLRAVPGTAVRPTADRVKEALFSMLGSRFDVAAGDLLDLFAGSGALGIEALSRGAPRGHVRRAGRAPRVASWSPTWRRAACARPRRSWPGPVPRALRELAERQARFDGVLLDPPYGKGLAAARWPRWERGSLLASRTRGWRSSITPTTAWRRPTAACG